MGSNHIIASEGDRDLRVRGLSPWTFRTLIGAACLVLGTGSLKAQTYPAPLEPQHDSRIFGIVPNFGTIPDKLHPVLLSPKFFSAREDFDRAGGQVQIPRYARDDNLPGGCHPEESSTRDLHFLLAFVLFGCGSAAL